ncbi:MAG: transglycosylase domain-containing protein [Chloroflexota bacterium]
MSRTLRVVARRQADRTRRRNAEARPRYRFVAPLLGVFSAGAIAVGLAIITSISALGVLSADLPDPTQLERLSFAQPTIVYDRDQSVELGRFERERRRVVSYAEIPRLVLDATTTAEDRSFWDNAGVDGAAIIAAVAESASGDRERGASTITQQLVRARLLPDDVVAPGSDRYLRKIKEIIQSLRLTDAFPGEEGKERVITAYLNEIFYGHGAYGIAAAARIYFAADLDELTVAQVALLAALAQAPTVLDPYRFAEADGEGRLVVPKHSAPVVRRDWIIRGLATAGRWTKLTPSQVKAALAEPAILAGESPAVVRGGQFTWQIRRQLGPILGPDADLETGGYRVITTLDWRAQRLAERWLAAAAISPNLSKKAAARLLDDLKIPKGDRAWVGALRGKDLHNGALVALDYRTGDVLAYAGSAGYARNDLASKKFDPKYDAAGDGARQPGSAFKPILYAAAFEAKRLTPGSLLLDITTEFDRKQDWAPRDADRLDRGPVLVRRALQYSLNVPAIRALERVGSEGVADTAAALGVRFAGGRDAFLAAGLAGALGTVETTPLDLTTAYATLGNDGVRVAPRMILEVRGPDGNVIWKAPDADGEPAVSAQTAFLVTDILQGNTDPKQNPIWAEKLQLRNGPDGKRRPAAVKTGTTNDARDLGTYGYLPPQPDGGVGLAVGVWLGNSDHSMPRSRKPATSLTAAAPLWRAFVRDYTKDWPVTAFKAPKSVVSATIDAWSGGKPGAWTRDRIKEWFVKGTEPGAKGAVDKAGLLYRRMCGGWRVDPVQAEVGPKAWLVDVEDWLRRARRGTGVEGVHDSRTAYFWGERSWGGPLAGACPRPKPKPAPVEKEPKVKPDEPGPDKPGGGGGDDPPKDPPGDD